MSRELSFLSELKATGHGKVWDHTDQMKFGQFGWRCTTNESSYSHNTLIGNWSEQKFDIHRVFQPKPIPSSYAHYFETTYQAGHSANKKNVPVAFKLGREREPTSYPGHQPELDPPSLKAQYNSFMTTSREAFRNPRELRNGQRTFKNY